MSDAQHEQNLRIIRGKFSILSALFFRSPQPTPTCIYFTLTLSDGMLPISLYITYISNSALLSTHYIIFFIFFHKLTSTSAFHPPEKSQVITSLSLAVLSPCLAANCLSPTTPQAFFRHSKISSGQRHQP